MNFCNCKFSFYVYFPWRGSVWDSIVKCKHDVKNHDALFYVHCHFIRMWQVQETRECEIVLVSAVWQQNNCCPTWSWPNLYDRLPGHQMKAVLFPANQLSSTTWCCLIYSPEVYVANGNDILVYDSSTTVWQCEDEPVANCAGKECVLWNEKYFVLHKCLFMFVCHQELSYEILSDKCCGNLLEIMH